MIKILQIRPYEEWLKELGWKIGKIYHMQSVCTFSLLKTRTRNRTMGKIKINVSSNFLSVKLLKLWINLLRIVIEIS